jgi:hypothetical protein
VINFKKVRGYVISFIIGAMATISTTTFAEDGLTKIDAFLRPSLPITLDGKSIQLDNPPLMYDGSTYVKLRDIQKVDPNLNVNWNDSTQTVELSTMTTTKTVQNTTTTPSSTISPSQESPKMTLDFIEGRINNINMLMHTERVILDPANGFTEEKKVQAQIRLDDLITQLAEFERQKTELVK